MIKIFDMCGDERGERKRQEIRKKEKEREGRREGGREREDEILLWTRTYLLIIQRRTHICRIDSLITHGNINTIVRTGWNPELIKFARQWTSLGLKVLFIGIFRHDRKMDQVSEVPRDKLLCVTAKPTEMYGQTDWMLRSVFSAEYNAFFARYTYKKII